MPSHSQNNRGLPLPDDLTPTDFICMTMRVPNVQEYRTAIVGQIQALGHWFTWEHSGNEGDTRASVAAQYWRDLIANYLCLDYGGVNVDCGCCPTFEEQLVYMETSMSDLKNSNWGSGYTDGDPQTIDSSCPTSGQSFSYDASSDGKDALCQAAKAFVIHILAATLIAYGFFAGILGVISGALSVLLGPLGGVIGGAATVIVGVAREGVIACLGDMEAIETVACNLYNGLKNLDTTEENFYAAIDDLPAGSGNAAVITTILKNTCGSSSLLGGLQRQYNYFEFLACLGQSFRNVLGDLKDCPCVDTGWCYDFDFTASDGGWVEWFGQGAEYVEGVGWSFINRTPSGIGLEIIRYFDASDITEIDIVTEGADIATGNLYVGFDPGGYYFVDTDYGDGEQVHFRTGLTQSGITSILVNLSAGSGTVCYVKEIKIKGTGVNPFGSDNC